MAKKIASLLDLSAELAKSEVLLHENLHKAIAKGADDVHATAVNKFGHYQPAIGPFQKWELLSIKTVTEKQNRGMNDPSPLIGAYGEHRYQEANQKTGQTYNGHLRNSIRVKTDGLVGVVGTNNKLAPHHEYGTRHIPPRPFLRPALYENQEHIKNLFKEAIAKTLLGL